ncbi:MAG: MarR family transcriptional regulator [Proteobacteria bacterium]|nr:MarR family transcriptional regulator [Pseudomonadota bacterium]
MTTQPMKSKPDPQAVADHIHSAAIHLLRSLKGKDKMLGINPAQLSALSVLYFLGPLTISRLAAAEGVKLPTISRLVKDMARGQLVMREKAENDARSTYISITPKGKALFERGRINRLMAITTALENLTDENLETLGKAATLMENAAKTVREA